MRKRLKALGLMASMKEEMKIRLMKKMVLAHELKGTLS